MSGQRDAKREGLPLDPAFHRHPSASLSTIFIAPALPITFPQHTVKFKRHFDIVCKRILKKKSLL